MRLQRMPLTIMATDTQHKWTFRSRFRRHAFGWRSQPAIKRITGVEVRAAYDCTMQAAAHAGCQSETFERVRALVAGENFGDRFVTRIIGRELGLN